MVTLMEKKEYLTMKRREFFKAGALVGAAAATVGFDGFSDGPKQTADQKRKSICPSQCVYAQ